MWHIPLIMVFFIAAVQSLFFSPPYPKCMKFPSCLKPDIGFKKLQEIKEMDSDKIICLLEKEENDFDKLLKEQLSPDKIVFIMHIIKKICESAFTESTGKILAVVCNEEFLIQLKQYMQDINVQDEQDKAINKFFWNDANLFWKSVLIFFETLLKILPNLACDVLPKMIQVLVVTIRDFTENIEESIEERLKEIQFKLKVCQEEREREKIHNKNKQLLDMEPPNDFRYVICY